MELRVWVDGTQRVVCGVKLTTTCQEIVFALAHATQQAGRFTMIERWRNNERLLSPNEQPLVTLQRWEGRMNEVEFILRKTSSEHQPAHSDRTSTNQLATGLNQQVSQLSRIDSNNAAHRDELARVSNDESALINGQRSNLPSNIATTSKQLILNDQQVPDNIFQQTHHYNPTRRPQTVLGPLTSSNSGLLLSSNYVPNKISGFSDSYRPSLSTSTLPNFANDISASPLNNMPTLRPRYSEGNSIGAKSPASNGDHHNGYPIQSENQQFQIQPNPAVAPQPKNILHEDLYNMVNKSRTNHIPPIVPAKPRLVPPLATQTSPQQAMPSIKNTQMHYYQPGQSPMALYAGTVRPRDPPGYLHYLEAMANRNSLPTPIMHNSNYLHHNQLLQGNIFSRQVDQRQVYQQNGTSPASSSTSNCYQVNGLTTRNNSNQSMDPSALGPNVHAANPLNQKFVESTGVVINRGSAVNVKLHSNSQPTSAMAPNTTYDNLNSSTHSNSSSSVSQMGHDMLKVIEEQKRLLINQKNELDRLDNDQEYLEAKQNSEQAELVNRIESEIRKLEELWGENQAQIRKLENQDLESELEHLKSEQVRMEQELTGQKDKLSKLENDIIECQIKIGQLEAELEDLGPDESILDSEKSIEGSITTLKTDLNSACTDSQSNDSSDSGGDASDDQNPLLESKLRNAREVPYVDKKGLISGIRSLKLDRSRSSNWSNENNRSNDISKDDVSNSPKPNDKTSNMNNNVESHRHESNGIQFKEKTANSNQYEFLMTL